MDLGSRITRREFIKVIFGSLASFFLLTNLSIKAKRKRPKLLVIRTKNPKKALKSILRDTMKKLIKKDGKVVIKPNIGFPRKPEEAANTNPEIVEAMVELCYEANAKKVVVFDHPCYKYYRVTYKLSGISEATRRAGGKMLDPSKKSKYISVRLKDSKKLKRISIFKELLRCDNFINIPIAKVHRLTKLTLSMKNLIGATWQMYRFHLVGIHQAIADFSTFIKPDLIVLDATRILLTNGPGGPGRVKDLSTIVIGTDPVAVDSFASRFFGMRGEDVKHIKIAYQMGLGEINLNKVEIKEITI